jgi:glycosyltransferase involved in cell wall biosynthesis
VSGPFLSAVVPCLNEAPGLPRLERELFAALDALSLDYEVLIIDDGSTDGTGELLEAMAARRPRLRLLSHGRNRGIGASLKTAISEAKGEWLVFLDADLTFSPEDIARLIAEQKKTGADCVSGSPALGGMPGVPLGRRLPSLLLNTFYRGLLAQTLTAFTPMFRLYRTADLREIQIETNGFEVSVEILARLLRAEKTVVEIPAALSTRTAGESKLQRWRELRAHARLACGLLLGK